MELSAAGREFIDALDPTELHVGNGDDGLPVWVGVDPENGKVYKIYANGLATGFGDGRMLIANGMSLPGGVACPTPMEQSTHGRDVMLAAGRKAHFYECDPQRRIPGLPA